MCKISKPCNVRNRSTCSSGLLGQSDLRNRRLMSLSNQCTYYVCVYIYIVYIYIYMYICVHVYVCIYGCAYTFTHLHTYYMCIYICIKERNCRRNKSQRYIRPTEWRQGGSWRPGGGPYKTVYHEHKKQRPVLYTYIYMHICMYTCIHVCPYTYTCVYITVYIYIYVWINREKYF